MLPMPVRLPPPRQSIIETCLMQRVTMPTPAPPVAPSKAQATPTPAATTLAPAATTAAAPAAAPAKAPVATAFVDASVAEASPAAMTPTAEPTTLLDLPVEILISVLQVVARHQCTLTNESTAPTKLDEGWEPQVCLREASRVVELMLVSQRFQQLARSPLIRRPDHWTAEVARMSTAFCGAPGLEAFYACSEADQATLSPRSSEWSASETRSHLLGHPECAQHVDPRLDDHVNAHLLRHLPWRSLPPHVQAIRYARHVVHAIAKIDKEAAAATTAAWTDQVSGTARGDFRARGTARGDQHCLPVDPFPQPPTPSPTHSYALKNDPKWWWQASLPFEVEEALLQGGVSPERIQERWAAVCECIQQMVGQWGRDSARHRLNTSGSQLSPRYSLVAPFSPHDCANVGYSVPVRSGPDLRGPSGLCEPGAPPALWRLVRVLGGMQRGRGGGQSQRAHH